MPKERQTLDEPTTTRADVINRLRKMAEFERFKLNQLGPSPRSLLIGVRDEAEANVAALDAAVSMLEGADA